MPKSEGYINVAVEVFLWLFLLTVIWGLVVVVGKNHAGVVQDHAGVVQYLEKPVYTFTDPRTGCQYLILNRTNITPRVGVPCIPENVSHDST